MAVGIETAEICGRVLSKYKGGNGSRHDNKYIACTEFPAMARPPSGLLSTAYCMCSTALREMSNNIRSRASGVQMKLVEYQNLGHSTNVVTRLVLRYFLPCALASGHVLPSPQPRVVGKWLEKIQEAFDILRDGVDAEKVVASMP